MHCSAATDNNKWLEGEEFETLLPFSALVCAIWMSVPCVSAQSVDCALNYDGIFNTIDTRFRYYCGHHKNYVAQQLVFLSTFHNFCVSMTVQFQI